MSTEPVGQLMRLTGNTTLVKARQLHRGNRQTRQTRACPTEPALALGSSGWTGSGWTGSGWTGPGEEWALRAPLSMVRPLGGTWRTRGDRDCGFGQNCVQSPAH